MPSLPEYVHVECLQAHEVAQGQAEGPHERRWWVGHPRVLQLLLREVHVGDAVELHQLVRLTGTRGEPAHRRRRNGRAQVSKDPDQLMRSAS